MHSSGEQKMTRVRINYIYTENIDITVDAHLLNNIAIDVDKPS